MVFAPSRARPYFGHSEHLLGTCFPMSQGQAATRSGIPSRSWEVGRKAMNCLIGEDLERALASRRGKFLEARFAAYYRVNTEPAAQKNVDMERAKSDLEEH